jgi:hypothetical protein
MDEMTGRSPLPPSLAREVCNGQSTCEKAFFMGVVMKVPVESATFCTVTRSSFDVPLSPPAFSPQPSTINVNSQPPIPHQVSDALTNNGARSGS